MIEIQGSCNTAKCFTDSIEASATEQIKSICDCPEFSDSKIRIMPDVHAGKGCTIGTAMTITDKIVPGFVGVDIGCGMETISGLSQNIDYKKLDEIIQRHVPSGFSVRKTPHFMSEYIELAELKCASDVNLDRARLSIGTLGGGNHFIEVAKALSGMTYLTVHSGSRHLGNEVAKLYQEAAWQELKQSGLSSVDTEEIVERLKNEGREKEIEATIKEARQGKVDIPKDLAYATGTLLDDYLHDMHIVQRYAEINRDAIVEVILAHTGIEHVGQFTTIHNYIDINMGILRKGAVSARKGELLLIPINMRDGSLICEGKGNPDWNYSAPHGAGRIMSRAQARRELSMQQFKAEMKDVYSTSVLESTIDEAPMAYKSMEEITTHISPTAQIIAAIKPVYNFKARG